MKVKFLVLGSGENSFHSSKTNRDYTRLRLMGMAEDCEGVKFGATADMGFDCSVSEVPPNNSTCILDVKEMSSRNGLTEFVFSGLYPVPAKK